MIAEFDAERADAYSLIQQIKILALTKSPRGQGFRSIALALPPSPEGAFSISSKISADCADDLADDCALGKVK